ncbi:MAG: hypothetical protein ACRDCT_09070, partial [Shewanella sp.]
ANTVLVGNTTITTDGLTIANGPSISSSGIDAGSKVISNVASGNVNNDATDNSNAANIGDVKKVASASKTEVTGVEGKTSVVSTTGTNGQTIYTVDLAKETTDSLAKADSALQSWKANVNGTSAATVDQTNNTVNFVNGTGTTASVVNGGIAYSVNKSDLTTEAGKVSAATAGDTFATAEEVAKAINHSGFNVTSSGNATGTTSELINSGETVTLAAGKNITVAQEGNKFSYDLAKEIEVDKLTAANTVLVGNTTITTDGLTIANGPSISSSGIDAGSKVISNVAAGKVSADSTDAINGSQLDTVAKVASAAKTKVEAGTNIASVSSSTGSNGQTIYTVNANGTSASAGSDKVSVKAGTKEGSNVTDYAIDLSDATKEQIAQGVTANTLAAKGLNIVADNGDADNVVLGETVIYTSADKNIITTASNNSIDFSLAKDIKVDTLTAGTTVVNTSGVKVGDNVTLTSDGLKVGNVNVSSSGIDAGAKVISNVKA